MMAQPMISVETTITATIDRVWTAYTSPDHVTHWNFASDDWHCPRATGDLRKGGAFSSRMEARDGSMGFDFEGIYTTIVERERIEYAFGDRHAIVSFLPEGDQVRVRVAFEPETEHPVEQQREGWQAILDNFGKYAARLQDR